MAEEVFQVLPAVDLLGEEAVRLEQGDFVRVAVRARPDEVLRRFAAAGARLIHLVDLDGARRGRIRPDVIGRLAQAAAPAGLQASGLPVLAAGGIRSGADLAAVAALGCEGAVVGRALLEGSLPLSVLA